MRLILALAALLVAIVVFSLSPRFVEPVIMVEGGYLADNGDPGLLKLFLID